MKLIGGKREWHKHTNSFIESVLQGMDALLRLFLHGGSLTMILLGKGIPLISTTLSLWEARF